MRSSIAVLVAAALLHTPVAAAWSWPVDGPVLRPFVLGNDPYSAGQHRGIDIGASPGTPVQAAAAGTVSFAGTVPAGGRTVTVRTADGLSVTYLELGAIHVARGAEVAESDPIGTIGSAAHVHFGVRVTADPNGYLDPLLLLPAREAASARAEPLETAPSVVGDPVAGQSDPAEPGVTTETAKKPEPASVATAPAPTATPVPTTTPTPAAADRASGLSGGEASPQPATIASVDSTPEPAPPAELAAERPDVPVSTAQAAAPLAPAARVEPRPAGNVAARALGVAVVRARPRDDGTASHPAVSGVRAPDDPAPTVASHRRPVAVDSAPRPRQDSTTPDVAPTAALGLLAAALLGAAWRARRRRHPDGSPLPALREAAPRAESQACPLGRAPAPRVIHACARARELCWFVPPARTRRRPVAALRRPPPGRRALAGTRG